MIDIPPFKNRYETVNVVLASIIAAITLVGVPTYIYFNGITTTEIWLAIGFWVLSGLGITAGYHRLFSHRTYDAHWTVRLFMAFAGAMAIQNSILFWSAMHRIHHRHVDDPHKDPYPITRGFWYAHIGWLLTKLEHIQIDFSNVKDLQKDWVVRWQHKYYWYIVGFMNVVVPLAIGFAIGRPLGVFVIAVVLRLFVVENIVFAINSLCHYWGRQPYSDKDSSRDSHLMAILAHGEGYHNFHHRFEYDYRNGHRWYEIDITKWLIASLAAVGLVSNRKRASRSQILAARTAMALKHAEKRHSCKQEWEQMRQRMETMREAMLDRVRTWEMLLDEKSRALKEARTEKVAELKQQLQQARQQWKRELNLWKIEMNYSLARLKALPAAA